MLAKRDLPPNYQAWNRRWGAPLGRPGFRRPLRNTWIDARQRGPFAWSGNNSTREFEFPWAYHQIAARGRGLTVVELGGGLSGLQFVLAREGYRVINVDPGVSGLARPDCDWGISDQLHRRLCEWYRAPVQLVPKKLQEAELPDGCADVVLSVSALEHFPPADIDAVVERIPRILKPNGVAIMTVDLFLDVEPFCDQESNKWGRNLNIADFLARSSLTLAEGNPEELLGFPEFEPKGVLRKLGTYCVGTGYPCLAQCFVARR